MFRILGPIFIAAALFATLAGFSPAAALAQNASPTPGDTEAVATQFVEAINSIFASGDAAGLDALIAADYVNHTPSPTRDGGVSAPDLAGLKESFEAVHAVFPGAKVTIDDAIVEGDLAALLVTFNGMGGADSESEGVIVLRIVDGKVTESWNFEEGGTARMQPMFEATPAA
jgi:predicted SnoaL-like aldol condensation-catalyzing enzyme